MSRHGIWYLRVVVPTKLRSLLGVRREFRRSLKTRDKKVATIAARGLIVALDLLGGGNMAKKDKEYVTNFLISGTDYRGNPFTVDFGGDFDREEKVADKYLNGPEGFTSPTPPTPSKEIEKLQTPLSEVCEAYFKFKVGGKGWNQKSQNQNRSTFALLTRIFGDLPFGEIGYDDMERFRELLTTLPSNMNKAKLFSGKSIQAILAMPDITPMSTTTANNHIQRVKALFEWGLQRDYTTKNFATGLSIKQVKRAEDDREVWTKEELKRLFEGPEYLKQKYEFEYWVPIIGLYNGCRLAEICQLYLSDIQTVDSVPVFSINADSDKFQGIKNALSKRIIPIHPNILKLGFLKYVRKLKKKEETRLFPEIKPMRDGYGQKPSRLFAEFRKKCGIKKDFHSFRHGFVTILKFDDDVKEWQTASIIGHSQGGMTNGRYGKSPTPTMMLEWIKKVDFGLKHPRCPHLD